MARRETSHSERVEMIQDKLNGMSLQKIAEKYGLNYYTVRTWWRRFRDQGWDGLHPRLSQRPRRGVLSTFTPLIRYVILRLKRQHPGWGSDVILLHLRRHRSLDGQKLPSRSAIAAYISPYLGRIKGHRVVVKRPKQSTPKVSAVHECWQMDFKGAESLGGCGSSAPFMVVDALSSAPLHTQLYPGDLKGVTWRNIQQELRRAFTSWGLPDFIRMDRGSIFIGGTRLEWPSGLLLWLVGLGVYPIINRPHRPTDNAQVERQNRVWQNHVAWGANFETMEDAQQETDHARHDRLYLLPSSNPVCQRQAPLVACPELIIPRRSYCPQQEASLFDFERVMLYLSDWSWIRLVDKTGCISLGNRNISVGRQYAGQAIETVFDLDMEQFMAQTCDETRATLRYFSLPEITPEHIMQLEEASLCNGG